MEKVKVKKAAEILGLSIRMVLFLYEYGTFPGARKLDPENPKSAVVIPLREVLAEKRRREKAAARS